MRTPSMIAAAIGLIAVGFAVGWKLSPSGANSPASLIEGPNAAAVTVAGGEVQPDQSGPDRSIVDTRDFGSRIADLAQMRDPSKRARMIAAIADDLTLEQVREALAAIETQGLRDRNAIRLQLLSRWAELEPETALAYARKLPGGSIAPGAIDAVIESWFERDPLAAERAVETMEEGFAKQIAWGALGDLIAEKDPQRAFTMLRKGMLSAERVQGLFEQWSLLNPEEAAAHARLLPPGFMRDLALRSATEKFAERDREAALAWAQALPATSMPGGSIERRDPGPMANVLKTWMGEDPEAALRWLEQLPEDVAKTDVLAALSRSLADGDPHQAVEVAAMMPAGKAQDSALSKLMRSWGEKDFAGALEWAREHDADMQQILLPHLVDQLALRDTTAALDLALSIGGKAGEGAVGNVLRVWTRKDPAAAAAWAGGQPDNATLLSRVAFTWAGRDEKKARAWIETLPPGDIKDGAVLSGVRCIVQTDQPQSAEQWIREISAPAQREAAYWELAHAWLRSNPKEARAWLATAPLSAKAKRELLQPESK